MMASDERPAATQMAAAWEAHELAQLRYFQALTLRQKLEAVQGMADVVRRFEQMRRAGKFTKAPPSKQPREGGQQHDDQTRQDL